uniref:GDT1-like protein 3 n=1 Tax=Rhizophora mucronata TaxID=61149 RepID=A0A2P2L9L4_RHIMU
MQTEENELKESLFSSTMNHEDIHSHDRAMNCTCVAPRAIVASIERSPHSYTL